MSVCVCVRACVRVLLVFGMAVLFFDALPWVWASFNTGKTKSTGSVPQSRSNKVLYLGVS